MAAVGGRVVLLHSKGYHFGGHYANNRLAAALA